MGLLRFAKHLSSKWFSRSISYIDFFSMCLALQSNPPEGPGFAAFFTVVIMHPCRRAQWLIYLKSQYLGTQEPEAGGSWVQNDPELHSNRKEKERKRWQNKCNQGQRQSETRKEEKKWIRRYRLCSWKERKWGWGGRPWVFSPKSSESSPALPSSLDWKLC